MVDKLIKDGKVAVILSTGYAGFSSWANSREEAEKLMFDPEIAQMIIDKKDMLDIINFTIEKYKNNHVSAFIYELAVTWIPVGKKFLIEEYDGLEVVLLEEDICFHQA